MMLTTRISTKEIKNKLTEKNYKMAKFKCVKCDKEIILSKHTMKVVDNSVVAAEARCCDTYMESIREKGGGLGGIIKKPNGQVSGKF